MNIFKTTIATAAVITCCMGNEYPANAEVSPREKISYNQGVDYGYALGVIAGSCMHYAEGSISAKNFRTTVEVANELEDTTPRVRRKVVDSITNNSTKGFRACIPIVRSVMGAPPAERSPYQSADNWY